MAVFTKESMIGDLSKMVQEGDFVCLSPVPGMLLVYIVDKADLVEGKASVSTASPFPVKAELGKYKLTFIEKIRR